MTTGVSFRNLWGRENIHVDKHTSWSRPMYVDEYYA